MVYTSVYGLKTWSWPNTSHAVVDFMHQGLCVGRRVSLTVHVKYMKNACTLHVKCMHITCKIHVKCMCITCKMHVKYM